ncbi:MAG: hypothetical protein ACLR8Y_06285 [Alistipes indistinctus]
MKKTTTLLLAGAVAALTVACGDGAGKKSAPMKIDNSLTEAEKSAGILTPEVMWKMGRVGGSVVSPDGETVLYTVSDYSMKDDKSSTHIWSVPTAGGEAVQITRRCGQRVVDPMGRRRQPHLLPFDAKRRGAAVERRSRRQRPAPAFGH